MAGEAKIDQYLRDEVQKRGGYIYKLVFTSINGAPDRLVWIPAWSIACLMEIKDNGEDLEDHQRRRHAELKKMGLRVGMVNSKLAVDKLMRMKW